MKGRRRGSASVWLSDMEVALFLLDRMSALGLRLIAILCLSCTALSGPEGGGVVWKDLGGTITIQCRSDPGQEFINLKKGLSQDDVLVQEINSDVRTIADKFQGRLQSNGAFPNIDILIKNLTFDDMGPYWCSYSKFDKKTNQIVSQDGKGSVLLVVSEYGGSSSTAKQCDPVNKDLVLVSVVISAAVLLGIVIGFLIWIIIKTKRLRSTVKPRRVTTNDVYEDMRGTIRR